MTVWSVKWAVSPVMLVIESVYVCVCVFLQAFELATGDYLFEPHSGDDYSRDEGMWSIYV